MSENDGSVSAGEGSPSGEASGEGAAPVQDAGVGAAGDAGVAAGAGSWLDTVTDPNIRQWADTKGWKDPGAVVQSAYNLERLMGGPADELVRIPQGANPWQNPDVLTRLGVPESPDGYELASGDVDPDQAAWAKGLFHEVKLSPEQAKRLDTAVAERNAELTQRHEDSLATMREAGDKALQDKWGAGYNSMVQQGRAAMRTLGLESEQIEALELSMGYEKVMTWAADIGSRLGEDTFVSGTDTGGDGYHHAMTPEKAKAVYESKLADESWKAALFNKHHVNHKAVMKEKQDLFTIMYGGGS